MNKSLTGLAGEYYVLAQLTHRGLVASLTLSTTKAVDILVTNQELNKLFKVEVKTTEKSAYSERHLGTTRFWMWPMSKNHEDIFDDKLYYCFVALIGIDKLPRFFIVLSSDVAKYVRKEHEYYLETRKRPVKETSIRKFRIPINDPHGYENNWEVFLS